jgi:DNA-binding CsgD family transcriptional regulator/tetratricopeptide (TPR) repeat protein
MELEPLGRDELGLLLAAVAEERPDDGLVAAIHARSEGNPFFAQELLAAAARGDERLGTYLLPQGDRDGGLAAYRRAVELVPEAPPSAERVWVLAALGHALSLSWRHAESRTACEAALAAAGALGDDRPAFRAMDVLGVDLCYLGHPDQGLELLGNARRRARERGTAHDLMRNNVLRSDVLLTTGRLREAAAVALEELANAQRLGRGRSVGIVLAANAAEALIGMGDWERAEGVLDEALRAGGTFWAYHPHLQRAQLAIGRGEPAAARAHLEAGARGAREPSSAAVYRCLVAELALLEGRPEAATAAVEEGLDAAAATGTDFLATRLCALGLRAEAERAQLAAARRDTSAVAAARQRAAGLAAEARRSASAGAAVTRDAAAWKALADAEHGRVGGLAQPERWRAAVAAWDELERPYLAAYCRWRQSEALLAAGHAAIEATGCARQAHRAATWLGARALQREIELLARRARLDLVGLLPDQRGPGTALGLTAREGEVLQLLARGYTNREIAAELTISVKTASVHVTHILRKLGVSRRLEAATLAHRLAPLPEE